MQNQYKVVRSNGIYFVVPASKEMAGTQFGKPGDKSECLRVAERLATMSARKASGGKKGAYIVERIGDSFSVMEAAIVNDVDLEPDEYQDNEDE